MFKFFPVVFGLFLLNCTSLFGPNSEIADNNNSIAQAETVIIGNPLDFKIYPAGDVDFFKIVVSKSGLLRIVVKQRPLDISLEMELKDSIGNIVVSTFLDDSIFYSAPIGTYYLSISDRWNDDSSSSVMKLNITMDTVDTFETNNSVLTANQIVMDVNYRAKIFPDIDVDYYKISLLQPCILKVVVDSISTQMNLNLSLLDSYGSSIFYNNLINRSVLVVKSLTAGNYYLKLQDGLNDASSDYPYNFSVSKYQVDTCEWNDSIAYAKSIDGIMSGNIYPLGDVDYFTFSKIDSSRTTIRVDSVSANYSMYIGLLNSEGTALYSTNGVGISVGNPVLLSCNLKAGKYYVRLKSWNSGSSAYSEKKYALTIQNN